MRLDGNGVGSMKTRHRVALSRWSVWSSLAMVPATWLLLFGGAPIVAAIYLSSLVVTLCYHVSMERRFVRLDHALAYSVIGANCWMSFWSRDATWTVAGILCVLVALSFYRRAKVSRRVYDRWHTLWHLACGVAGWCFARGYLA